MAKRKNRKVTTKKKQMTKVNLRAKRNYKDTVFRMLFSDKRNLLSHLSEPSKSPASIAKSNKQWVGTCLYQEECKLLLINCEAVIRL